ncbi:tannase and feruloyl esterase [Auricularia subglabra TFB-10046 SS5]|nr:tannase and feruloyl esterase [Auricularia subglabra TFB-10046 SS5]
MFHAPWAPLTLSLLALAPAAIAHKPAYAARCMQLARTRIENAHSIHALYLRPNESYRVPASCGTGLGEDLRARASVDTCVVNVVYNTSASSVTRIEVWLPDADTWSGRILGTGGGGFGGCVDYYDLNWGTSLGFAAFGHDGGHDGESGAVFVPSDEIVVDWAHRSLHVATVAAKLLVREYYKRHYRKSYYIGCSTGGRQGIRSVQDYPEDFDGVLAGAPAINFVHLMAAHGIHSTAAQVLDPRAWELVTKEIVRQCDGLDGLHDGIVDYPDACAFVPEVLLCDRKKKTDCLSVGQVNAIRRVHTLLYGGDGRILSARLDPGAEGDPNWWRHVVYNDSTWEPGPDFGLKELADAEQREKQVPVSSFDPNIDAFRKRGGKLLTYHGSRDILVPHGNSLLYYQLVARTLGLPPAKLDDFYRLFLIPGMSHCFMGPGAWAFGQVSFAGWSNSSDSNALFALVDWVEKGKAPDTLRGMALDAPSNTSFPIMRLHCKYPARSIWKAEANDWVCVDTP